MSFNLFFKKKKKTQYRKSYKTDTLINYEVSEAGLPPRRSPAMPASLPGPERPALCFLTNHHLGPCGSVWHLFSLHHLFGLAQRFPSFPFFSKQSVLERLGRLTWRVSHGLAFTVHPAVSFHEFCIACKLAAGASGLLIQSFIFKRDSFSLISFLDVTIGTGLHWCDSVMRKH